VRGGDRIERVDVTRQQVHPPEQAAGDIPDGSFGQFALRRDGKLGLECPGHGASLMRA
jgi:hypothetical protein